MAKTLQCKDISDRPILEMLARQPGVGHTWRTSSTWMPTVADAMPEGVPSKLRLAKMKQLIRRGLVDGCDCGCRGDFEITEKGLAFLAIPPGTDGTPEENRR